MICNKNYLADILRVCEIKDLIWVMRFRSPLVYIHAAVPDFINMSHYERLKDLYLQITQSNIGSVRREIKITIRILFMIAISFEQIKTTLILIAIHL